MGRVRDATHAGSWYEGTATELRRRLGGWMRAVSADEGVDALGIVSPHAGYMYSGEVAASVYDAVKIPQTALILNPNHRGMGAAFALYPDGEWETPLGSVPIDSEFNRLLLKNCDLVEEDERAHAYEHSGELQVPFLRFRREDVCISVICMSRDELDALRGLAEGIARSINEAKKGVLIVASSDMSHYEPLKAAERKDRLALSMIEALDAEGLYRVVYRERISMCGVAPVVTMLFAAKELGARTAKVLHYRTSGDVTGDYDAVVGYAAVVVE